MAAGREWAALQRPGGRAIIVIIALGVLAIAARWRTTRSANSADAMQFEEFEEAEILSLELSNDGLRLRNTAP